MKDITQGTIISGLRSSKYKIESYGIIISARCDIANNKISKIYYLFAIPLKKWLMTDFGFFLSTKVYRNEIEGQLKNFCQTIDCNWEIIKNFDDSDFEIIYDTYCSKPKKKQEMIDKFSLYKILSNPIADDIKLQQISQVGNKIKMFLSDISNNKHTNLALIPEREINGFNDSLIVDFEELDYLDLQEINLLIDNKIDIKNTELSETQLLSLNKKFTILDAPGFSMVFSAISSPWIEYIMQRFSSFFTRIGVDNLNEEEMDIIIESVNVGG